MSLKSSMRILLLAVLCFFYTLSLSQQNGRSGKSPVREAIPATKVNIREHLKIFEDSTGGATYRISLCADVPNNKKPLRVSHKQETGHVFLVLQKIYSSGDTLSRVFGFYPKKGLSTLLFKKTKSLIKDNSHREYDAEISKELSAQEFDTVLAKAVFYADRKYHMNRYNCYDYAVLVYNSVAGEGSLPITHVRFPFIFGKGGSPCSVYRDLQKMKTSRAVAASYIRFADMTAPKSSGRETALPSELSANQSVAR